MKNFGYVLLTLTSLVPMLLSADLPGHPSSASGKQSNPNPFAQPPQPKEAPLPRPKRPLPPVATKDSGPPFTLPGIIGYKEGQWDGSDNLYNLSPNISVFIEIVAPEDKKFDLSDSDLQTVVQGVFAKSGINPAALHIPGDPSLPLFHVLIMLDSIDQFAVACCACRLFEAVDLKRVVLERGITYQAITWEKQTLLSGTRKDFNTLVTKTIEDLTSSFVQRYQYFQNLRNQRQF